MGTDLKHIGDTQKKDKKRQYRKHRVLTPWTRKIINDRPQWPKHRSNQHHRQSDSKWICPHLAKRRLIWDFSRTGSFPGSTMGSFPRRTCSEITISTNLHLSWQIQA